MRNIKKENINFDELIVEVLKMKEFTVKEKMDKNNAIGKLINQILSVLKLSIDKNESTRLIELSERLIKKQTQLFESLSHQLFDTQKVLSNAKKDL